VVEQSYSLTEIPSITICHLFKIFKLLFFIQFTAIYYSTAYTQGYTQVIHNILALLYIVLLIQGIIILAAFRLKNPGFKHPGSLKKDNQSAMGIKKTVFNSCIQKIQAYIHNTQALFAI